jgi:uncharacterized membrane protein YdjX (TVP38/TMEM64 family)
MRRRVILVGLSLAAAAALLALSPWREALAGAAGWARGAGAVGVLAFAATFVAASTLALPVWPLTVAAGVAYGAWRGFALALPASAVGATAAFLLGRTLLRRAVERRVASSPRLAALDDAVSREGPALVLLLRLSPVAPYNVVNYALSASRVRALPFAGASLVGMAPITLAWAWAGAALGDLKGLPSGPQGPAAGWVRWGGLAATVAVVLLLARMARKAMNARQ